MRDNRQQLIIWALLSAVLLCLGLWSIYSGYNLSVGEVFPQVTIQQVEFSFIFGYLFFVAAVITALIGFLWLKKS